MDVGIRALKQNASAVVARAASGEIITITDHGKPVARLTPLPSSPVDELLASGRLRPPVLAGAAFDVPEPASPEGPSLSELIDDSRDDRL